MSEYDGIRRASAQFNALPRETRTSAMPIIVSTQIRQLLREKDRLKRQYERSLREVNDHIGNLERSLVKALESSDE